MPSATPIAKRDSFSGREKTADHGYVEIRNVLEEQRRSFGIAHFADISGYLVFGGDGFFYPAQFFFGFEKRYEFPQIVEGHRTISLVTA